MGPVESGSSAPIGLRAPGRVAGTRTCASCCFCGGSCAHGAYSDDSEDDDTGGAPIGGPTRQSPRGKVARAKRRHEKAKAKEEAKKAAEKELADAGRVARATKRAITGAD